MEQISKWTPKEVRKTISLIGGLVLIGAGIYLLCNQINANGTVDIKSALLSGHIQSGSAGLISIFFGVMVVILSNISTNTENLKFIKENKIIILAIVFLFVLTTIVLSAMFPEVRVIGCFTIAFLATSISKLIMSFINQ